MQGRGSYNWTYDKGFPFEEISVEIRGSEGYVGAGSVVRRN